MNRPTIALDMIAVAIARVKEARAYLQQLRDDPRSTQEQRHMAKYALLATEKDFHLQRANVEQALEYLHHLEEQARLPRGWR